ncbi:MAG: Biopolymer transport protein ExbD/TolR [Cytophagales bacterium]|jgi:biopolymer transport protein ExbD|nr:biopolymer transporter ExbD [Bacteroidota bacterium]MBS1982447.1 biopolymer transporter ExbD [Bacteroidota bacterium]WHZ06286.1 MAG: Biopolymer transport protein ExbD/TolR [Cytophagales bacterium]
MAEVQGGGGEGGKKGGKVRSKKTSTRIDMTPMVDLAFLLLTFFVLTSTLSKPKTMEITLPEKPKEGDKQPEVNEKKVLTLVLGSNDKVYWYVGITEPEAKREDFSKNGIRKVLLEKKGEIRDMIVLIKAMDNSKYKNFVEILDEMSICNIQRYAIVDITPADKEIVKQAKL